MRKIVFSLVCMLVACLTKASESKVAEVYDAVMPTITMRQTYQHDGTLAKEIFLISYANKDYASVSCDKDPDPGQNPYQGQYTLHDSICLYKMEPHQAEQHYHDVKNQLAEQRALQQARGTQPQRQPPTIKRETRKRKKTAREPLHMVLRSSTQKRQK